MLSEFDHPLFGLEEYFLERNRSRGGSDHTLSTEPPNHFWIGFHNQPTPKHGGASSNNHCYYTFLFTYSPAISSVNPLGKTIFSRTDGPVDFKASTDACSFPAIFPRLCYFPFDYICIFSGCYIRWDVSEGLLCVTFNKIDIKI